MLDGYFGFLKSEFDLSKQSEIGKFLSVTQSRIAQLKDNRSINARLWRKLLTPIFRKGREQGISESNKRVLDFMKAQMGFAQDGQLSKFLSVTNPAVSQWRNGIALLPIGQFQKVLKSIEGIKLVTLVEMEPIYPDKPGGKWYLHTSEQGKPSQKRDKIIEKMRGKRGIYCYFDSLGRPTYFGKADKMSLEHEAENRLGAEVSHIRYHRNFKKFKSVNNPRQGELARFLSAYEINPRSAISTIEALMIRGSANILFNKRLEKIK